MIDVARTSRRPSGAKPPSIEQNAEVRAIDCAISSQTRWALRACRFECDGVDVAPRDAGQVRPVYSVVLIVLKVPPFSRDSNNNPVPGATSTPKSAATEASGLGCKLKSG